MYNNSSKSQRGITIIELMIALLLSLFLLGGVIQVFLSNKVSYRFNDALARVQENGRFVLETMAYDIRMADYWGCLGGFAPGQVNNLLNPDPLYDNFSTVGGGIAGDNASGPDFSGLGGSDEITLRGGFADAVNVNMVPQTTAAALQVTTNSGQQEGDIILVSDCQRADIFQITSINTSAGMDNIVHNTGTGGPPGNASQDVAKRYGPDSQIMKISTMTYSIGTAMNKEPALFRAVDEVAAGFANEIASGIEDMQILFGEDVADNGVADRYVDASDATLIMENVVSIRIMLLVRSAEANVVDEPQQVTYNGQTLPAAVIADRRLRQVFSATIGVRNRIL